MRWHDLTMEPLEIPFRASFEHAAAKRVRGESVLVRALSAGGRLGLGEGCPRHYVTSETAETASAFFNVHRGDWLHVHTPDDLRQWTNANRLLIDHNPAAFCAVELALLNAMAGRTGQSIESLLCLPALSDQFHYTGILGSRDPNTFAGLLERYRQMSISDLKVKLFGDETIDRRNAALLKRLGAGGFRLRYDANNRWIDPDQAIAHIRGLGLDASGIEEPLAPRDYAGCRAVAAGLGSRVILDESCRTLGDLERLPDVPDTWVINIRVSKMGGLLRSLEVAAAARARGLPVIVGAHVGETAILTRAALTIANACRDVLVGQEGAFGSYLLEHDLVEPSLRFGAGGVLAAADVPRWIGN